MLLLHACTDACMHVKRSLHDTNHLLGWNLDRRGRVMCMLDGRLDELHVTSTADAELLHALK